MGRRTKLRDFYGVLKDKASLSKATLLSKPNTSTLQLAILRATTHDPSTPPHEKHVIVLLSYGHSSRNTASTCIEALMDGLHNTHNSFVAFKSLITVHFIIKRGSFILQDQLSVYPSVGGRNYLNLSNFRHNSTPETWNLSLWVRWYARVLESLLLTSRNLGFFFSTSAIDKQVERVSSFLNKDLLREIDVLVSLIEEICKAPDMLNVQENKLIIEAMILVGEDYCSAQKEIFLRINELRERLGSLSFVDSVELVCILKRFENCKERLLLLFLNRKGSVGDILWSLIEEMKETIGEGKEYGDRMLVRRIGWSVGSESARFGERMLRPDDSVKFASGRLSLVRLPLPIQESVEFTL